MKVCACRSQARHVCMYACAREMEEWGSRCPKWEDKDSISDTRTYTNQRKDEIQCMHACMHVVNGLACMHAGDKQRDAKEKDRPAAAHCHALAASASVQP
jgi:hypothetical protein